MTQDHELIASLGGNELFRLHRARRTRTGAPLLLKKATRDPPRATDRAALERECELIASLAASSVLEPRMVALRRGHAIAMNDPGGCLLSALDASSRPGVQGVLAIGIALARSLAELHRRGIVHNGVRPEAILCDADHARAWLIDFSDANHVPAMDAARLVYASPEQTGRMERAVDHRSDLYALGVVLYELLTGAPLFASDDPLELIHSHIAKTPSPPAHSAARVPEPLSAIVMKLLAKTPEERYQSAAGLCEDLSVCAREWAANRSIAPFALGRRDQADRLTISPRVYGRERELGLLLSAFEKARLAATGRPTMLLVAGYAGIGKSALIHDLYKPIVRQHGYFVSGKFDQLMRSVPFGALIDAFRQLVRQLLTESEAQLEGWRTRLAQALGANGGVIAEVIPEIEFIIGPQAAPVALGPAETLNRFQLVLQNFVAALAQPGHPLVVFLDDLQWADAATLSLLEPLLASRETRQLLLVGAYRDNELDNAHRLTRSLIALESAGVELQRIVLGPLQSADLGRLVRDCLHGELADALPLARLVFEKTAGNPFFVIQLLKTLERDGHFRYDDQLARWSYDIDSIALAPLADNVVELTTRNIQRLSAKSQSMLTLAASIGNRFDAATLAIISEQSPDAAAADLEPAIAAGLILRAARRQGDEGDSTTAEQEAGNPRYAFVHDRVQQAAYAMIPEQHKPVLHLSIGRLLQSRATPEETEARLFDIVHHLNIGKGLISADAERLELARLDLLAGRRAKSSTAHEAALGWLHSGVSLLRAEHWLSEYELCFALYFEAAESHYLCGQFDAAAQHLALLLQRARSTVDRAQVYRLQSVQYENQARYADALASARVALSLFGVSLPEPEAEKVDALEREIEAIARLRGWRSISSLVDLPAMSDPEIRIVMSLLTDIWATTFILGDPTLARLISATMVRLSLVHGNVEESAYGYVTHAITVGPVRGDYAAAYEFGTLALAVNERFGDSRRRAKIYQQFHAHVNFWRQPMASCIPYAREACRSGLESGDFLYAAYGAGTEPWSAIVATQDLAQFVRDYTPHVALIERLKNTGFADSVKIILNWARALQGQTAGRLSLSDVHIDEADYVRTYRENPFFATFHAVARLHVACLLGTPDEALDAARVAGATVHHTLGTMWPPIYEFWNAIAIAAADDRTSDPQREAGRAQLRRARESLRVLAENCPANFRCQWLLIGAEIERIEGREPAAQDSYEQAVESAAAPGMLQHRSLACELYARFQRGRGRLRAATLLIGEAHAAYARWGALAKVEQLERDWPELLPSGEGGEALPAAEAPLPEAPAPAGAVGADASGLDLYSVMKAAQAIAGETDLDQLLARLMSIAIENAGADWGCLVLEGDAGAVVHSADSAPAAGSPAPRSPPASIVNYVRRTSESVVLADAATDDRYGGDPYITQHRPRSVMCVPVQRQGRLIGILYLENRMVYGAFTPDRIRVMRVLAAEAAISLANARLVEGLKQEIGERKQAEHRLSAALAEVERLTEGLQAENRYLRSDLIANVSHDLRTPLVSLRGYLELLAAKDETLPADTRRSYLDIAVRQSEHLAKLIDELFELAKLDFKGLQLDREAFQFVELATDVMQKFQLAADAKQVSIGVEARAGLPLVQADLGLIERVLDNLIANALQHTPSGGRVCVRVSAEGERVTARVQDTGNGIPEAELPFIFDRFYRVDKSRSQGKGAGLGLAITKRILELHDTGIAVQSTAMAGSCFSFSLPVAGTA